MKEIKVRAYDKVTETMIYSDRENITNCVIYFFGMDSKGSLKCFWQENYDDKFCYPAINDGELDNIMQYTGLKDSKGKDIYEGDIVELTYDGKFLVDDYYKADKFIVDLNTRTWLKGEEFGYEGEGLISWENTVVIGNIYENQEIFEGLYNTEITNQNNMTMENY